MKNNTIKRMKEDYDFNMWLSDILGSGYMQTAYEGNLSCYLESYKGKDITVLVNTRSEDVLETFYIHGCHLSVDNPLGSLYEAFSYNLKLETVYKYTHNLKSCSAYMLNVLEKSKCKGDLYRLPRAAKLIKDFSMEKYLRMSYDSQVVFDLLTKTVLPKITEESSIEEKVEFIKWLINEANLSGYIEVQLSRSCFVKFDCRNGQAIFTHYTDSELSEYKAKENLLLNHYYDFTRDDLDTLDKDFPSIYKAASGNSNLVVLKSYYEIDRFSKVIPCFDYFSKKRTPYKDAILGYSIVLDLSKVEDKGDFMVDKGISTSLVSYVANPQVGSYTILDVSPIEYNYLRPSVIEKYFGKPLLIQEEGGFIVASTGWVRKIQYQLFDTFIRSIVSRIKLESVRNLLGEFLTEAFGLLVKDKQAFEEKYFSSLESTYNFYTLLTKNYKTLSTYHPKKQGLFRVVKLEEKKEDFSEEDIRNAFKYIDSSSKEFFSEIQKLRKSAKGTGVKI